MSTKKAGKWGTSLALRLDQEFNELNIKKGDKVHVYIVDNKIMIEKVISEFSVINGVKFAVKED
ncbi:MAG: Toxin SymE, type I toxin-antitoxin system [Bacteriophage sp.]|nr:MAG: Toxin SymE, type I toxin-antitoxin system [Bacteriophage sp.]UWG92243.1 MAG: Toxin SymE, type I toxin-antitoxin system [Bacteriophage sp.]WBK39654.1 hypothetical protein CB452P1_000070 [Clostridium phage CB452P1]